MALTVISFGSVLQLLAAYSHIWCIGKASLTRRKSACNWLGPCVCASPNTLRSWSTRRASNGTDPGIWLAMAPCPVLGLAPR